MSCFNYAMSTPSAEVTSCCVSLHEVMLACVLTNVFYLHFT